MSELSTLGKALQTYALMVESDATDGLIVAARVTEQELFLFFLEQGSSTFEARLSATLFINRMVT